MRDPIDDAIAALRRGEQAKAFALLRGRLTHDPRDAAAWLWMSEATPDLQRKMEALERFIVLAPDHPRVPSARARLLYLDSQLAKAPAESRPPVVIRFREADPVTSAAPDVPPPIAPAPDLPPHPSEPEQRPFSVPQPEIARGEATPVAEPSLPPTRDFQPGEQTRAAPSVGETAPRTRTLTASMSAATAPHVYHPAMPALLQSLLDTAPMPSVRTDLPVEPRPDAEPPRRRAVERTRGAEPAESQPDALSAKEITAIPAAPAEESATRGRATPWWAWSMLVLMTIQIALLVYIILRIEYLVATVP